METFRSSIKTERPRISASLISGSIHLTADFYNTELLAYYRGLGAFIIPKTETWKLRATVGTAWSLYNETRWQMNLSTEIRELAVPLLKKFDPDSAENPEIEVFPSWEHQKEAYSFAKRLPASMLALWMGTGKTKITIDLIRNRGCKQILILCPLAVVGVWPREFRKHWSGEMPEMVMLDKPSSTTARAEKLKKTDSASSRVAIVNYEAVRAKWDKIKRKGNGTPLFYALWEREWDMVICDESHRISSHTSQQSRGARLIGMKSPYRLALTGTPMRQGPLDLFGQFFFLDPGIYGPSWTRFRSMYAKIGRFGANHIVGYINQEDLARRMGMLAYEVDDSVLDLPESHDIEVPYELGPKTKKAYRDIEKEMIAHIEEGSITPANGLVKLLRLQQIVSGFVMTDDEELAIIGDEKQEALYNLLLDIDEPVIIFTKFKHELIQVQDVIERVVNKTGRDIRYGEISGARKDLTEDAMMPEDVDIMGVQIQSGNLGIDLTRAAVGIYYSNTWSLSDFEQSLARIKRPGQTRNVRYFYLIAAGTVDRKVFAALAKRRNVIKEIISYLRGNKSE